jgi:hypothetical protein
LGQHGFAILDLLGKVAGFRFQSAGLRWSIIPAFGPESFDRLGVHIHAAIGGAVLSLRAILGVRRKVTNETSCALLRRRNARSGTFGAAMNLLAPCPV